MKWSRFFWGSIFILAAAYLVVTRILNIDIDISLWRLLAGAAVLYLFCIFLTGLHIVGIIGSLAGLYCIFAPYINMIAPPLAPLCGAVLLLSIGLYILFGSRCKRRRKAQNCSHKDAAGIFGAHETNGMDYDTVYKQINCGRSEVYLRSRNFKKGEFISNLSDMHVYCNDAQLDPDGASIILDCTMGSLKLHIPRTWRVNLDINVMMGNAPEKNRYNDAEGPLLTVTGSVKMGQIEIIYI